MDGSDMPAVRPAQGGTPEARRTLTWSLVVCTYKRPEILCECVRDALRQTRPPLEVVIVDASPDWEANRAKMEAIVGETDVPLSYVEASQRSSSVQRNQAAKLAHGDILFMIDDDSLMYPDCAAALMRVYEADAAEEIVAVGAVDSPPYRAISENGAVTRKDSGTIAFFSRMPKLAESRLGRFVFFKLLMMGHVNGFIPYDTVDFRPLKTPCRLKPLGVYACHDIPGYALTVRRSVVLKEKFDTILRYYAAMEDADASHRFRRHGLLLRCRDAKLHHFTTAGGRLSRKTITTLQLFNLAVFLKRNASMQDLKKKQYMYLVYRKLYAEFFKDLLSRRFDFPQFRAVIYVIANVGAVFQKTPEELEAWYPEFQKRLVEG
jgi:GT2 family glycosyltransferase